MFFQPFNGYHSWPWYCLLVALLFGLSEASVAVTGVHTGYNGAARPSRRNILDLYSDPDQSQWSLFIQALAAFQKAPESSDLSYYGICGIHGRPYTSWDGVGQGSGSPLTGYCTHDSVLFPTWHRPYLALYEQQLATYAQSIAQTYTPTLLPTYRNAADVLRIPYWDWAANATVPDCVNAATVSIIAPDGSTQQVSNPLQQYNFQTFPLNPNYFPTSSSRAGDWFLANYRNTVRSPDTNGGASDYAAVNTAMNNQGLKAATWNTFTKAKTFNGMATMIVGSNSIEGYHGNVHVVVGGNYGHMTYLSYAAFDPIFWLHHTNVDRIFALWEAIYPTTTMTPITEQYGTFAIPRGQTNTASSPLPPFSSSSAQNFYTSTGSMQMSTFGYTYPEINDWSQSQSQLQSNVTAQVTSLYGNGQTFKKRTTTDQHSTHTHHSHIKRADNGIALNQYREWSIEISVQKYAIQGQSFKITCFLGSVPTNPVDWLTSSNVVGSLAVLPNKAYASPTDGVSYPNSTVMHEISLQEGLARIAGFEVDDDVGIVGEYLKGNLKWVVQLVDGTPVESCDSLDIMVVDEIVTMPDTLYELPSYGKKTLHPEITGGQLGGYGYMKRRKFL